MNRISIDVGRWCVGLAMTLISLLGVCPEAFAASEIGGQSFVEHVRLDDTDLQLNGVGMRAVLWIKGYAAGLYLRAKAATPAEVLAQRGPKRIDMRMMLDVDSQEFVKAVEGGVRDNSTDAEMHALADRLQRFERVIASLGALKKGDIVHLDFMPDRGLVLTMNGTVRGEPIAGEDLYAAVLKIFLGVKPVDRALKEGLLGRH